MKFTKLKLFNLKGVTSLDINLTGKDIVKGRNGFGKSSVLNAIEFAMTGKISASNRIDNYIKKDSTGIEVVLHLVTDTPHIIVRRSDKFLTLDGNQVTQEKLESALGFNSLEFVASTFSSYFMKLEEDDKAKLLNVSSLEQVIKRFIPDCKERGINDLDKSLANITKELINNKKVIEYLNAEIHSLNNQLLVKENEIK